MRITVNNFNGKSETEQFKVVILHSNIVNNTVDIYTSNIVTIRNHIEGLHEYLTEREIILDDNSNGVYPYYAFDQVLAPNQVHQASKNRKATLKYNTNLDLLNTHINKVIWKIPANQCQFVFNDEVSINSVYYENGYSCFSYLIVSSKDLPEYSINYKISERRYSEAVNKIICIVTLDDGIDYLFEKEVSFTVAGSGGTDNSVIIRLEEKDGALRHTVNSAGETLYLRPSVYDVDGNEIKLSDEDITLSYYANSNRIIELLPTVREDDGRYKLIFPPYDLAAKGLPLIAFELNFKISTISSKDLVIKEIIGIPFQNTKITTEIIYCGPREIVYDSSGINPAYDKTLPTVIPEELLPPQGKTRWRTDGVLSRYRIIYPTLNSDGTILLPRNSFDPLLEKYIFGLILGTGRDYIQPIIIRQNRYFSRIINEWDGSLKISDDGNYILSAAYVAGGKNAEDKFEGLLMGKLSNLALTEESLIEETGLFGYNDGVQTFGFRTKGTAFIGRSGGGRIEFDGNYGLIQSGNFNFDKWLQAPVTGSKKPIFQVKGQGYELIDDYINTGNGALFDLQSGNLFVANGVFTGEVNAASGKIGGWNLKDNTLYAEITKNDGSIQGTGFQPPEEDTIYSIAVGYSNFNDWSNAKFRVSHEGDVTSEGDMKILGTGEIAGWTFNSTSLYTGLNTSSSAPTFYLGTADIQKPISIAGSSDKTNWRLKISNNFGVDSAGELYAARGKIGSWKVGTAPMGSAYDGALYSEKNTDGYVVFLRNGGSIEVAFGVKHGISSTAADGTTTTIWTDKFYVKNNGQLYAGGGGQIAGWYFNENSFYTNSNTLYLGTQGIEANIGDYSRSGLVFKAGDNFGVNSDGNLYANDANISGQLIANNESQIGGWRINDNTISNNDITDFSVQLKSPTAFDHWTRESDVLVITDKNNQSNHFKYRTVISSDGTIINNGNESKTSEKYSGSTFIITNGMLKSSTYVEGEDTIDNIIKNQQYGVEIVGGSINFYVDDTKPKLQIDPTAIRFTNAFAITQYYGNEEDVTMQFNKLRSTDVINVQTAVQREGMAPVHYIYNTKDKTLFLILEDIIKAIHSLEGYKFLKTDMFT